jgi:hypothetical protein
MYLYELRKWERMMGNNKFGTFVLLVTTLSTTVLASLSVTFGEVPATGPFPLVAALLVLHHTFVPVTQPRMFRILGVNFTDKAPFYAFTVPVRVRLFLSYHWLRIFYALSQFFIAAVIVRAAFLRPGRRLVAPERVRSLQRLALYEQSRGRAELAAARAPA